MFIVSALGGVIAIQAIVGSALAIVPDLRVERLNHTCVICRLGRMDTKCLGVTWPTYRASGCSQWYAAHMERSHVHVWERGTCVCSRDVAGKWMMALCSPGSYPIHSLPPATQLAVYQHFKDPREAKKLFESLTDERSGNERLGDEIFQDRGHLTVDALREWETAGVPGAWDGWWKRFYAKHVSERKKPQAGMKDGIPLKFLDLRRQPPKKAE